ncbi:carboxylating nicotinate-nucleotide diphosphorylase [Xylella fastidiosa]|uniref:carboxylating nicotinate-nucleotide diphosphorylase n=1 Tax=Xylella fastidiosa TaxID=2371 RepID=UPI000FFF4224|nr:carboxylating nicotinate-nucleotide diphosphorylase [Xylella fastidiosa]RWA37199.1 nicotinate-nucleotide diphosphorylase (carboxylating) [Xylella fastidiosa subsp. multiplex]
MNLVSLPRIIIEPMVRHALAEDLGLAGDITSAAVIPEKHRSTVIIVARQSGVIAGLDMAELAFQLIDAELVMMRHVHDGMKVEPGDVIATITGCSRALLTAERTALNFLSHLSGIATATASIATAIAGTKTIVVCTRKTLPGIRTLQKYAVRAGGGMNHRFALYDAMLIKDNHIAIAGSVREALRHAKAMAGHLVNIEIEVDTLEQLHEAMEIGVNAVLLDNMQPSELREAVNIVAGRAITEASGRITPETAINIAASGVDLISVGWITHSAPILDIGLDFKSAASSDR